MKNTRIYGEKHNICYENTHNFYNERAKKINEMVCPYTAVLLADQKPEVAEQWDIYEKKEMLPRIDINAQSKVLDIGCGMGRLAEAIIPVSEYYCGIDFSEEMIKLAEKRCHYENNNYDFIVSSFQEVSKKLSNYYENGGRFNRVIISGVCMYINDSDMSACVKSLLPLLDKDCILYFKETVALQERLTLDDHPSEALKTTYDVIYRTAKEYLDYYLIFVEHGFEVKAEGYLPHISKGKEYSETERWHIILQR